MLYIPGLSSLTSYLVHGKVGEDTEDYKFDKLLQEGPEALRFWINLLIWFIPALLCLGPRVGPLSSSVGGGDSLYAMLQGWHCLGHNGPLWKEVKTRASRCLWYPITPHSYLLNSNHNLPKPLSHANLSFLN